MTTASNVIEEAGSTRTKSFRNSIPTAGVSVTIPNRVNTGIFRNAGTVDLRLRFNNTGADYFTIPVGDKITVGLSDSVVMDAAGVGSPGILECIFW